MFAYLEAIIAEGYREGLAQYGDLGLDQEAYAGRIHAIVQKNVGANASESAIVSFAQKLHLVDLYLATACAQNGLQGKTQTRAGSVTEGGQAWKVLEWNFKGFIRDLSRFVSRKGFVAHDLADSVLADLFFPSRSGASRIVSYDGRSSLKTWLRVVVCNRAINAQRNGQLVDSIDNLSDLPDTPALERIDTGIRKRRYRSAVQDALHYACRRLATRERLMLLWRYDDGLLLGQIAQLLGIHQSNVTRQLERLQTRVRKEVVRILAERHGLSLAAINECLQDLAESPQPTSILELIKAASDISGSSPAHAAEAATQVTPNGMAAAPVSNDLYWPTVLDGNKRPARLGSPGADPQ
jgi:RNA polymerase sigma-70 factor